MNAAVGTVLLQMAPEMEQPQLLALFEESKLALSRVETLEEVLRSVSVKPAPDYVVLVAPDDAFADSAHYRLIKKIAKISATLILFQDPTPLQVKFAYRSGACDVLFLPLDLKRLQQSFSRLNQFADVRKENIRYRAELEHANRALQEQLKYLKMDQLAGLEVQKSLLPPSPMRMGKYEVSHFVKPSLYLSGDFVGYNFVLDRFILFYFADVSGHGSSSAFITVMLRFIINRVIRKHIQKKDIVALMHAPEGVIEHVNEHLLASDLDKHLTIVCGAIDTHTDMLRYTIGAQYPVPIFVENEVSSFIEWDFKGKPAGLYQDATWRVYERQLPEEFSLALLSDGFLDLLQGTGAEKETQLLDIVGVNCTSIKDIESAFNIADIETPQDDLSALLVTRRKQR